MRAPREDSQQPELKSFALVGGDSRYEIGSHIATWQRRSNDEKIVDLSFRGKHFEITQEGSGPSGRPRMFINGIRRPDGRLFQGRSLKELVRMLDLYFDDFIEIPARLERIERKIDTLIGRRRESKTKLCLAPITANWPQERYIPKAALGGFAKVPVPMIAASQCMAAGEYRVLQAVLFCAQGTGLLIVGKKRLAKRCKREGGQICAKRGTTVVPYKTSNKTSTNKTSNKKLVIAPDGESVLLAQIGGILGEPEMKKKGGIWRNRIRGGPAERRALRHTIEDYNVRTPDQRSQIRDRPAWFTDRYTRNLVEVNDAAEQPKR